MALPPDKKIPGTDKLTDAAGDLARKAEAVANSAAQKATDVGNTAKASITGAASDAAKTAGSVVPKTTVQPGNQGTGGLPPMPKQSNANVDIPPPLPATTKTSTAAPTPPPLATTGYSDSRATAGDRPAGQRPAAAAGNTAARPAGNAPGRSVSDAPGRPIGARPASRPSGARPADRPPARPPAPRGRPVTGSGRPPPREPGRPMAPPPGARNGRYAAPPRQHGRRGGGYIPPAAAASTGSNAWLPLLFGLLLLGGVAWYAIKHYTPMINADLTERTNGALADAGLGEFASVEIDGRNAILTGKVGSQPDSDRAEEVVANTTGVRSVDNQLAIGEIAQAQRIQPSLSFASNENGVELSGTVSDQAYATKIENTAKETYGEDNVTGSITVDPNSTNPGWWPAVEQLTPDLQALDGGSFAVADGALVLTGTAPEEQAKADIEAKATELLNGQLTVDNQITVAEAPVVLEPGFATYYNSPDRIALYGTLPADSAASIASAFEGASKPVESFIVSSDGHLAPEWVANFGGSLDAMQDIEKGKVKIQPSGDVVISGITTSEDAKTTAGEKISALFEGQSIDNRIAVRAPEPEPAPAPEPEPEPAPAPFMKPFATISSSGNDVQLVGLLPAAAAESITNVLESNGSTVIANITVDERVMQPAWTDAITQSFASLRDLENAKVIVSSGGDLTLSGTAANQAALDQATVNAQAPFGNSVSLRNDIIAKGPDIRELFAQIDLAAIRFRSNSSELDTDSVSILDQVADALAQSPETTVAISGHTDSTGNDERNLVLSRERAEKVRNYLIDRGISGDRMTSQGYGSTQPIASNNTVTGRALNRRIEFGLN